MSNLSVGQILLDAQRVASRVKDLDALSNALLVEAEGNNRLVESLRQFQDDLESLNRISSNKSNAEIINRIQQQNAHSSEILKENRELKICLEDYEYAMELLMQKYRQHMSNKVMDSKINFREAYNDKLWNIIRQQREKINEMAAVMQRCAAIDDEDMNKELETISRLRLENQTLRELLQISKQGAFGSTTIRLNDHLLVDRSVQTEIVNDMLCDELTVSSTWTDDANSTIVENVNSNNNNNNNDEDHLNDITATGAVVNSTTTTNNANSIDGTHCVALVKEENLDNHEDEATNAVNNISNKTNANEQTSSSSTSSSSSSSSSSPSSTTSSLIKSET